MAQEKMNVDHVTGRDLPDGDGGVGDEQVNRINDRGEGKETGQDHSTDREHELDDDEGVGVVQESSDTLSDVANIDDRQ